MPCYGVMRAGIVTRFGSRLDAAYEYWCGCLGSVLVYRESGRWGRERRETRWLRLLPIQLD